MMMTPEELAADQAVIEAATEGPWEDGIGSIEQGPIEVGEGKFRYLDLETIVSAHSISDGGFSNQEPIECTKEDRQFIVQARTRWPAALKEIGRLRAIVEAAPDLDKLAGDVDASELARLREEVPKMRSANLRLTDQLNQARAALRQVPYVYNPMAGYLCPWCTAHTAAKERMWHFPDCTRQAALGLNEEAGAT